MPNKIFCLVLNYNNFHDTQKCIQALQKSDRPATTQIIIIDNSPSKQSSDYLQAKFPSLKIIRNSKNLGFAGGNNVGIKYALRNGATHILIINPDVIVGKSFFQPLLSGLKADPNIGLIAPAIRHQQQGITHYGLEGSIDWNMAKASHTNLKKLPAKNQLRFGDFVTFACVLTRTEVFKKAGLLDDRYFMYLEDVDYCLTAKNNGFWSAVDTGVVVSHNTSSSFKKPTDKLIISFFSQLKFIHKWLPFPANLQPFIYTLFFYPYLYCLWTWHYYKGFLNPKT